MPLLVEAHSLVQRPAKIKTRKSGYFLLKSGKISD